MTQPSKPKEFIVVESAVMRAVEGAIEEASEHDHPVLIEGEPGCGRELVARIIHLASARRLQSFVTIKGGTAPTGAFSDPLAAASPSILRRAQGGTLLVKDLCALPRRSQDQLYEILCDGASPGAREPVDVRVVSTTDPDLAQAVDAGVFSPELFRCMSRHRIVMPPLRERSADIAPLAEQFIRGYSKIMGRSRVRVSTRAYDRLLSYPWPGNVAELKGVCRRLAMRAENGRVEPEDVDAVLPHVAERTPLENMSFEDMVRAKLSQFLRKMDGYPIDQLYEEVLSRVERPLFQLILDYTGNNQVKAAEILGVSRNTLRRKLAERGIRPQPKGATPPLGVSVPAKRERG